MEPEANLHEQRHLADCILTDRMMDNTPDWADAARLAELVVALDGWPTSGGFLPPDWTGSTTRRGDQ